MRSLGRFIAAIHVLEGYPVLLGARCAARPNIVAPGFAWATSCTGLYRFDGNRQTLAPQVMEKQAVRRIAWRRKLVAGFARRLNRDMPENTTIGLQVWWPLVLIPVVLVNQLLTPHAVWMALLIVLIGIYATGYAWVRHQAPLVTTLRERVGVILVAGDTLREDFELQNHSRLPLLWAEFADDSDVPHYQPGRVVACGAFGFYRWRAEVVCERRGVFHLGPYRVRFGDPFGLFTVDLNYPDVEVLLIYPRVAKLPALRLPHGNSGGSDQRRRPVRGTLPTATVSEYRPGDSLRHIHWRTSARQNRLMVKDLEIEPSGDVWIVLDLYRHVHSTGGPASTLEYAVTVAASLAAELLSGGDRRAVGLLAVAQPAGADGIAVNVEPLPGQAQLWTILSALASVQEGEVTLAELLHSSREILGRRRTLVVITPQIEPVSREIRAQGSPRARRSPEVRMDSAHSLPTSICCRNLTWQMVIAAACWIPPLGWRSSCTCAHWVWTAAYCWSRQEMMNTYWRGGPEGSPEGFPGGNHKRGNPRGCPYGRGA